MKPRKKKTKGNRIGPEMSGTFFFVLIVFLSHNLFAQRSATYTIYFAPNSSVPTVADEFRLESFVSLPDSLYITDIDIHGYTDDIGNKSYNDSLSSRRASQIRNLLIELGVNARLIRQSTGKGEKPVAGTLNAEQQRALNRRVEVIMQFDSKKKQHHHAHRKTEKGIVKDTVLIKSPETTIKRDTIIIVKRDTVVIVKRDTVFIVKEGTGSKVIQQPAEKTEEKSGVKSKLLSDSIKVGDKITLPNVLFEGGTRKLLRESYNTLDQLVAVLDANKEIKIRILGHICCQKKGKDGIDDETGRKNLSVVRAKAVYEYLISKGIERDRLSYKGMKANFKTGKGAHFDRRVEIEIVQLKSGKK